jgi:hypothetical protein
LADDVNHYAVVRGLMRDLYVVVVSGNGGQHVSFPASNNLCHDVKDQLKRYYLGFEFNFSIDIQVCPADHPSVKHGQYCK